MSRSRFTLWVLAMLTVATVVHEICDEQIATNDRQSTEHENIVAMQRHTPVTFYRLDGVDSSGVVHWHSGQ